MTYLKKVRDMKPNFEKWKISPLRTSANSLDGKYNRGRSVSFEVNIRRMLACYWLGTGSADMVKLFSMLGFWFHVAVYQMIHKEPKNDKQRYNNCVPTCDQ